MSSYGLTYRSTMYYPNLTASKFIALPYSWKRISVLTRICFSLQEIQYLIITPPKHMQTIFILSMIRYTWCTYDPPIISLRSHHNYKSHCFDEKLPYLVKDCEQYMILKWSKCQNASWDASTSWDTEYNLACNFLLKLLELLDNFNIY